jgi:type II secretory ATPase GspE/PulE/Tfp pilus assembly ATPase PilB-like protein
MSQVRESSVQFLDAALNRAVRARSSDLHIDPYEEKLCLRMRIDGGLSEAEVASKQMHAELIARIKVLAGLRTDEHNRPQDGRFRFVTDNGMPIDIRVSILPTHHGENAVLRLLSAGEEQLTLEELGFTDAQRVILLRTLEHPHGLVLATGPTGSGKTTTLYAFARLLNAPDRSLVTIEDPVEYAIPGVRHVEVNHQSGLTFGSGLRGILRQDPDTLLVGEVRDQETANLAVNAALTGHLVLSTLHTNDALSAIPRLLDFSVEPYLIAETLRAVVAQRLVRRICVSCRMEVSANGNERQALSETAASALVPKSFFRGAGCDQCLGTGYAGRIGIYEILEIPSSLREAWHGRQGGAALRSLAARSGMEPLVLDGIRKAGLGLTTLEEVLRTRHA